VHHGHGVLHEVFAKLKHIASSIGISTSSTSSGLQSIGDKKLKLTSQPWANFNFNFNPLHKNLNVKK
jgi:hypothetical protein